MNKIENLSYRDLDVGSGQSPLPLSWKSPSDDVNRIIFPSCITGTNANIIILSPDHFPTASSNDALAYFTLRHMIENKNVINNTVEVCAFDSMIVSYAWASSVLGLKCIIRTPQMTYSYWIKRATDYDAKIEFEGVKVTDATRIIDSNKKKKNFISQFQSLVSYTYHADVTGKWIAKALEGIGNNKMALLVYPASSGALTGAASTAKTLYPYSKSLLVEPSTSSTFYNNKKGVHGLYGMGYGFIPYIHNIMATDYVMLVEEDEVIKTLKCTEDFDEKITSQFNADSKTIKPIVGRLGLSTVACTIAAITLARQLHLTEDDNVLIIGEDTSVPYREILKSELIEDIDVKSIIEEAFINSKYRPLIDVTGQRQRERLFKKKGDHWLKRGVEESVLEEMKNEDYWKNLPRY